MDVFKYNDYRSFLRDMVTEQQEKDKKKSIRQILRGAKIKSPSYYREVAVLGEKNMSLNKAGNFASYFELNTKETDYLFAMVKYINADESEKAKYHAGMIRLKPEVTVQCHNLGMYEYKYLENWEMPAIRELLKYYTGFRNDSAEERRRLGEQFLPKVPEIKVQRAIEVLESLNFIKKNEFGYYQRTEENLRCSHKTAAARYAIQEYLTNANRCLKINITDPEKRLFKNSTISISGSMYKIIEKKVNEFCHEILEMIAHDPHKEDRLYSLGVQLFPLTKLPKEEK
jgi:uncharacterized protein (TIGR02147 family)